MTDKRVFPRKKRRVMVSFEVDGRTVKGFTLDLSHTGLLISSYHLPPLGKPLCVTLEFSNGNRMQVTGSVVRARRLPGELAQGAGSAFGVALDGYFESYARMVTELS